MERVLSGPNTMRAMVFSEPGKPLVPAEIPIPEPVADELLLRVEACGVCRTDLHIVDGELTEPSVPLVPGHQIVGEVVAAGAATGADRVGRRVGVPWLGGSCGDCNFCGAGQENLCDEAVYTGYQRNGGFAEFAVARADYCFDLPADYPAAQAAPLLCAGLIGYRAYRMAVDIAGSSTNLGLVGFGASAHILAQLAIADGRKVFAVTREGDDAAQAFARELGASWAGANLQDVPEQLDAAIIFAPDGALVPAALAALRKGGRVVCAGIHMSDIPSFPYSDLWGERSILSVANLTRRDGQEFLPLAAKLPLHTEVHEYPLADANRALDDLRAGAFTGAAVIVP